MEEIKLCKTFKFLSASLDKVLNKHLKDLDLSITQGVVLLWLSDAPEGQLPIKTIEKKFGTAQSTTLGVVNRLEQKKLVTTTLTAQRTKMVAITPEGLSMESTIRGHILQADALLFSDFTPGEQQLFIELLKKAEGTFLQHHDIEIGDYYE